MSLALKSTIRRLRYLEETCVQDAYGNGESNNDTFDQPSVLRLPTAPMW